MRLLQDITESILPYRFRRFVRATHREFIFRRAMSKFLKNPADYVHSKNAVLSDLIYGWGNESWSALDEYLSACIEHALNSQGPILECGSGLSTILVGAIAKQRGLSHWALEHTPGWAEKVQKRLNGYNIDTVVLCVKPLKDYGDYSWYDVPLESMPASFSLVICDGPPGSTKGGRYGLVPVMRKRLKAGCIILLDDVAREQELSITQKWEDDLGATAEFFGSIKPYVKLAVIEK